MVSHPVSWVLTLFLTLVLAAMVLALRGSCSSHS